MTVSMIDYHTEQTNRETGGSDGKWSEIGRTWPENNHRVSIIDYIDLPFALIFQLPCEGSNYGWKQDENVWREEERMETEEEWQRRRNRSIRVERQRQFRPRSIFLCNFFIYFAYCSVINCVHVLCTSSIIFSIYCTYMRYLTNQWFFICFFFESLTCKLLPTCSLFPAPPDDLHFPLYFDLPSILYFTSIHIPISSLFLSSYPSLSHPS